MPDFHTDINPESLPKRSEEHTSALKLFGTVALSLVAFGVGIKAITQLQGRVGQGLLKTLPKEFKKRANEYAHSVGRPGRAGLSDIVKGAPGIEPISRGYNRLMQPARAALRDFRKGKVDVSKDFAGTTLRFKEASVSSKLQYGKDFLLKPGYGLRAAGKLEEYGRRYVATSFGVYGVDRLSRGFITRGEEERDKYNPPSLWNLPATAWDYAKFTARWLPQDMMFSGVFGALQSGISGAAFRNFTERAIKPHSEFITRQIKKVSEGQQGFGEVINKNAQRIAATFRATSEVAGRFNRGELFTNKILGIREQAGKKGKVTFRFNTGKEMLKKAVFGIRKAKKIFRETYRSKPHKTRSLQQYELGQKLGFMDDMIQHAKISDLSPGQMRIGIKKAFGSSFEKPAGNFITKVLGWKHARLSDLRPEKSAEFLSDVLNMNILTTRTKAKFNFIRDTAKHPEVDPATDYLINAAQKAYVGGGIYRTKFGNIVNLRTMKPGELLKRVSKIGINIPGGNRIAIGNLMKLDSWLHKKTGEQANAVLREGHGVYVPHPMSNTYRRFTSDFGVSKTPEFRAIIGGNPVRFHDNRWETMNIHKADDWVEWNPGANNINLTLIPENPGGDLHFLQASMAGDIQKTWGAIHDQGLNEYFPAKMKRFTEKYELFNLARDEKNPWIGQRLMRMARSRIMGKATLFQEKNNTFRGLYDQLTREQSLDENTLRSAFFRMRGIYEHVSNESYNILKNNLDKLSTRSKLLFEEKTGLKMDNLLETMYNEEDLLDFAKRHVVVGAEKLKPYAANTINVLDNIRIRGRKEGLQHDYARREGLLDSLFMKGSQSHTGSDELRKFYMFEQLSGIANNGATLDNSFKMIADELKKAGAIGFDEASYLKGMDVWNKTSSLMGRDMIINPQTGKPQRTLYEFMKFGSDVGINEVRGDLNQFLKVVGRDKVRDLDDLSVAINFRGRGFRDYSKRNYEIVGRTRAPYIAISNSERFFRKTPLRDIVPDIKIPFMNTTLRDIVGETGMPLPSRYHKFQLGAMYTISRVTDLMEDFLPVGFNRERWNTPSKMIYGGIFRRVLQGAAALTAYQTLDAVTDSNPLFDGSLAYNELILIRNIESKDIELIEIGKFVEEYEWKEYESWTNHDGDIGFKQITGGIKHKRETNLVRVELEHGGDILITDNHSIFTGNEDNLIEVEPKIGNKIIACSTVPKSDKEYNTFNILNNISGEFNGIDSDYRGKQKRLFVSLKDDNIKNTNWYHKSDYFNDEYFDWLHSGIIYSKSKYRCSINHAKDCPSDKIELLRLRQYRSNKSIPVTYDLNRDFGYLVGIFVAEGSLYFTEKTSGVHISCKRRVHKYKGNIYNRILQCTQSVFGDDNIEKREDGVKLNGQIYYDFFIKILKCGEGAYDKTIPSIILNANEETKKGFIEGYFDGDGCYNQSSKYISFTTVSRKLAIKLNFLLRQLGAQLRLYSRQRESFTYMGRPIRFNYREYDVSIRNYTIRNMESPYSEHKRVLKKNNVSSNIVSMEPIDQDEYVYDISVKDSEKFVAGFGLIYAHNTMFDEGITVAAAEQIAKARLATAKLADITGITGGAKYLEGLMPGSTSFLPGAGIGAYLASGGPLGVMTAGLIGGFANRYLATMGPVPDWTKGYEELQEIYAGKQLVPIRRGRNYLFGRTPIEGGRIDRFAPNWFHRIKSQYKNTPDVYGSKMESLMYKPWPIIDFNPLAFVLGDRYHYEKKHYHTRPYPVTGIPFKDIPLIGPLLSSTVGRLIKPPLEMHRAEMEAAYYDNIVRSNPDQAGSYASRYNPPPSYGTGTGASVGTTGSEFIPGTLRNRRPTPENPFGMRQTISEGLYRGWIEPFGMPGFLSQTLMGGASPFSGDPVLANAADITSGRRAYNDMNLGDFPMGYGELTRRFMPVKRSKLEIMNPIKNRMADWMPGGPESDHFIDMKTGDPFTKVTAGVQRIPGSAYESLFDIKHSYPGRASMMGKSIEDQVSYFLGIDQPFSDETEEILESGSKIHSMMQRTLVDANIGAKAEAYVFDPRADISGHVDLILRGPKGISPIEIKSVSGEGFARLQRPRFTHRSQLNEYLRQLKVGQGYVLYISRDDPSMMKSFPITYSPELSQFNLNLLEEARNIANEKREQGIGYNGGQSYSRLDRLRILSDIAPYSKNYKTALADVRMLIREGVLTDGEKSEYEGILKNRKATTQQYELYPYRFLRGGIISPSSEYQLLSQNENIKAAAEYSLPERIAGAFWEKVIHADTPFHTKLLQYRSPIEMYHKRVIEMQDFAGWENPIRNFIKPYGYGLASSKSLMEGGTSAAMGGFLMGGPFGATLGGVLGGAYGAARGTFEALGGEPFMPGPVKRERELAEYFDKLKYMKARMMFEQTGDLAQKQLMQETMVGMDPNDNTSAGWTSMYRSIPFNERPYLDAFINTKDHEGREEIKSIVPSGVRRILEAKWKEGDYMISDYNASRDLSEYFSNHFLPDRDWAGYHPMVNVEDIELRTFQREGLDAHRMGLGWFEQERRIRSSPFIPGPIDIAADGRSLNPDVSSITSNEIRNIISDIMRSFGIIGTNVFISQIPGAASDIEINLNINTDMSSEFKKNADMIASLGVL